MTKPLSSVCVCVCVCAQLINTRYYNVCKLSKCKDGKKKHDVRSSNPMVSKVCKVILHTLVRLTLSFQSLHAVSFPPFSLLCIAEEMDLHQEFPPQRPWLGL